MKVTWIIFIGTYFAFGIFLSESSSATYPFSIIHSTGVPGFSTEFTSLTGWILTTLAVTHLMTRSTFAASISHLNTTHRSPKGIFGSSKTRGDDDDDEDSEKSSSIKDKARLFLGTLNRNNCFAKVLCGLGSQTPSEKTDLLNDYVFLMNDLLYDDETADPKRPKRRKRPNSNNPYTRDDIRNGGGGGYDEDEEGGRPFEHEIDEDGELDNFDKEFDYATLGDLADEEMVSEDGPSVMSYIMQEAKNKIPRLKLRVGRSIKENITKTTAPKVSSGEMGSAEADSYVLLKKMELNKTQDVEKTLKIATEAGNKLRSARQCRLLFDQCPFAANQITEILGNLRKILQGQPVSQPTSAFFPAFAAQPGVLSQSRPVQTAQSVTGGNNNNVDKVEIVVHLNGAKNANGGYATQTNSNIAPPPQMAPVYAPPAPVYAAPAPMYAPPRLPPVPPQPVHAGSLNPVSEPQPQIPIPSEIPAEPTTNTSSTDPDMANPTEPQILPQTIPQAVQEPTPHLSPMQPYPQAAQQQTLQQQALQQQAVQQQTLQQQAIQQQIAQMTALQQQQYPQAVPTAPQYQYPPQMTPEMIMQMYPQMAGAGGQAVTQDKIIDFLQGILEHNANGEAQSPLVPKNGKNKVNSIIIDGKEVPTTQYLQNLKKTLQTLAQMNKLALATEAQIVAKDAANGEPSEEDEDSPEDDDGGAGTFPDLFSDGPDLTTLTQNESSEEEEDKVVKLKPQKGIHHNQRPTGIRPSQATKLKKPWGKGHVQQDDPFEDGEEIRKDTSKRKDAQGKRKDAQLIDAFIKAGISQPKPKEEVQPSRKKKKKKKKNELQYNRRKKKPNPVSKENDSVEPEDKQQDYAANQEDKQQYDTADTDDKQQDDTSGEESEEEPQDEESSEDDEGEFEKPPKNSRPKIKFSLKQQINNVSTTQDPYLPSPEEKEKLNILTDILLPGAYDRPKGSKGSRPKGNSRPKRPTHHPIKIPASSNFNQEFEKISTDIGGNGTEILHIDEFSENSDKVPLFKKSKRKRPKGPKVESDEEEDEEEDENEERTDMEDYEEGSGKGRRMLRKPPRQRVALVALPYENDDPEEDDGKLPTATSSSIQTNIMSYLVGLTGVKPVNPLPTEDPGTHPFEHYLTYKAPYQPDEKPSKHPFAFYKAGYSTPAPDVFSKNPQRRDEEDSSEEEKAKYEKDKKDKKKDDDKKKKKKKKDKDKDESEEEGESTQYHYNHIPPKTEHGHGEVNHDDPSKTKGIYLSMTMHDDGFPLTPDAYELALPIPHINDGFVSVPAPEEHHDYGHLHHPHDHEEYSHHAGHPHHHHPMPHHHHHHHPHHHDEDDDSEEKKKKKKKKGKDKDKKKKKKKDKDDDDDDGDHGWGSDEEDDDKDKDKKKGKGKKKKGKDDEDSDDGEEDDIADVPPESEPIRQALSKVIPGFGKQPQTQSQFSENQSQFSKSPQRNPYLDGPLLLPLPPEPEDDEDDDTTSGETSVETVPKRKSPNQNSVKTSSPAPTTNSTSGSNTPTTKPKRVMNYKAVVRRASTTTFRPRLRNTTLKPNRESEESSESNSAPSKSSQRRPQRQKNNFRAGLPMHQHDNQPLMSSEIHFDAEDDGRSGLNNKGGSSSSQQFGPASEEGHEHSGVPNDGIPSLRLPDSGDPYEVKGPDGNRYPVYEDPRPLTVLPLPDLTTLFSGLKNINFGGHFHG